MARYLSEEQAEADGFGIEHEADKHRFIVVKGGEQFGEAHYSLIGEGEGAAIDFDHTYVSPELRGTGLAGLLAERALTDEIAEGRRILASCSFIEGYLERNPHLRGEQRA